MLILENINKTYKNKGTNQVNSLKNINLNFNLGEFIAIIGYSGAGKTTLLNILGGLDKYDTGDLIIDNNSTKEFKDKDWVNYRKNKVGFVFQNINLISNLTALVSDKEKNRLEWKERVKQFRESNISMKILCNDEEFKVHQLQYWLKKYNNNSELPNHTFIS